MGHYTNECPEMKSKDSSEESRGGLAMMCFEVCDSPVEGESEQTSAHHTAQPHLEVTNLEVRSNKLRSSFRSTIRTKFVTSRLIEYGKPAKHK